MNERLNMSNGDIDRLRTIREILDGRLKWAEAAEVLGVCERQVARLCAQVREEGNRGILHGLCGRRSNHRLDEELLGQALSALYSPRWEKFGPTFAQEQLDERCGIALGVSTVRRLMMLGGLWEPHRRRARHRAWRERRSCVGMLTQLDGSPHDWLEGRGPRCTLIDYIDDATSGVFHLEFVDEEDTLNLMRTSRTYLRKRGRPVALYVDKDSIYNVNRSPSVEEQLRAADPITQFTRAMGALGVKVILAHSPQAKGRVERGFSTHQDRLVKELRLEGISTMKEGNRYLREIYIPKHNRRYAVEPAEPVDVHKPILPSQDLDAILSIQEDRQVYNDSVVRFENRFLLLREGHGLRPGTKVIVQKRLDGTLRIERQGRYFQFQQVPARPHVPEQLRRARPRHLVLARPKLPRNPFFVSGAAGASVPAIAPTSAVLA